MSTIPLLLFILLFWLPRIEQHSQILFQEASAERECQNTSDILGFAVIHFDETTVIPFYPGSDSAKRPVQVVRFYDEPSTNSLSFRVEGKESYPLLRPEAHKLDYFIFDLPVRSRQDGWLEVVVDQKSRKMLFVQENQVVRFVDWLSKMQRAFAVERLNRENPLRSAPNEAADEVEVTGRDCFKVNEMTEDWIQVIQQDICNGKPKSNASGWIRWRDRQGCLLVQIYPFA